MINLVYLPSPILHLYSLSLIPSFLPMTLTLFILSPHPHSQPSFHVFILNPYLLSSFSTLIPYLYFQPLSHVLNCHYVSSFLALVIYSRSLLLWMAIITLIRVFIYFYFFILLSTSF